MNPLGQFESLRANAEHLNRALSRCAKRPGKGPVHHLRTSTRRVEAMLETVEPERHKGKGAAKAEKAQARLKKLLHKMRHRAGVVRDADVHLQMLRNVRQQAIAELRTRSRQTQHSSELVHECRILEAELAHRRSDMAVKLQHRAARWQGKFDKRLQAVVQADPAAQNGQDGPTRSARDVALVSFVELCKRTPVLDAATLHGFRKGTKRARYQAETGADDQSRRIGGHLKQMQDAIGVWHDWLALVEEGRKLAQDAHSLSLLQHRLEDRRDREFRKALHITERLKKQLLEHAARRLPGHEKPHRAAA